jgi:hypothetical protein
MLYLRITEIFLTLSAKIVWQTLFADKPKSSFRPGSERNAVMTGIHPASEQDLPVVKPTKSRELFVAKIRVRIVASSPKSMGEGWLRQVAKALI